MKKRKSQDYWNMKPLSTKSSSIKWKTTQFSWNLPGGPFFNFKDSDKDRVPDVWDCARNDPTRQGPLHSKKKKKSETEQSTLEDFGTKIKTKPKGEWEGISAQKEKAYYSAEKEPKETTTQTTLEEHIEEEKPSRFEKAKEKIKSGTKKVIGATEDYTEAFPESGVSKTGKAIKKYVSEVGEPTGEGGSKASKEDMEKIIERKVKEKLKEREEEKRKETRRKEWIEGPSRSPVKRQKMITTATAEAGLEAAATRGEQLVPSAYSLLTTPSVYTPYVHRRMQQDMMQKQLVPRKSELSVFDIMREEEQLRKEQGLTKPLPPIGVVDHETGEMRRVQPYSPVTTRQSFSVQPFIGKPPLEQPTWGQQRPKGPLLTDQITPRPFGQSRVPGQIVFAKIIPLTSAPGGSGRQPGSVSMATMASLKAVPGGGGRQPGTVPMTTFKMLRFGGI